MVGNNMKSGPSAIGALHVPGLKGTPAPATAPAGTNGAASASDARILALEQRVAHLEAVLEQIAAVLVIANGGQNVTLKGHKIEVDAENDVKIRGGMQVHVSAATDLTLKSGGMAKLEGNSGLVVKATGTTKVNGSKVILNDGTKGVARHSDAVLGVNGVGAVIGGSGTVLA